MAEVGMDADVVRGLSSKLDVEAGRIATVVGDVDRLLSGIDAEWLGRDADQFVGWWRQQHRVALLALHDAVAGLAQSVRNNASAQDTASSSEGAAVGVAAGAGGVAVAAGGAAVAGGAAAPGSAPGGSAVGAANVAAFAAAHPAGTRIGDGQCVQVFEAYNQNVVHAPFIGVGANGGAKDFYQRFDSLPNMSKFYEKVPVGSPPLAGDVVVWGAHGTNPYGHIAVVTGSNKSGFTVIEQNAPREGSPIRTQPYSSTANVLGYLRPKQDL